MNDINKLQTLSISGAIISVVLMVNMILLSQDITPIHPLLAVCMFLLPAYGMHCFNNGRRMAKMTIPEFQRDYSGKFIRDLVAFLLLTAALLYATNSVLFVFGVTLLVSGYAAASFMTGYDIGVKNVHKE